MKPETVGAILDAIARLWPLEPDAEITLEANPTSVEAERFRGYRAAGVNRVSLGVQALNDADLKALGRLHTARRGDGGGRYSPRSIFERYSFDLIYARPQQSVAAWKSGTRQRPARVARSSLAVSADDRARHDVRAAARAGKLDRAHHRSGPRFLGRDAGDDECGRAAGL